jgi:hypothetical protein
MSLIFISVVPFLIWLLEKFVFLGDGAALHHLLQQLQVISGSDHLGAQFPHLIASCLFRGFLTGVHSSHQLHGFYLAMDGPKLPAPD